MRWVGHAARTGARTGSCRVLVGKLEVKDHLEDLGLDGSIILKLIVKKLDGRACDLAESEDKRRAVATATMTFRVP